jgi:hypothetical protein
MNFDLMTDKTGAVSGSATDICTIRRKRLVSIVPLGEWEKAPFLWAKTSVWFLHHDAGKKVAKTHRHKAESTTESGMAMASATLSLCASNCPLQPAAVDFLSRFQAAQEGMKFLQ